RVRGRLHHRAPRDGGPARARHHRHRARQGNFRGPGGASKHANLAAPRNRPCGPPILRNDLTRTLPGSASFRQAVRALGARSLALSWFAIWAPTRLFVVYNTVYNTVLLGLPFLCLTVTVT